MSLLCVEDLTVERGGVRVLEGVSLRVEAGEWVGVIGPNGAGKSSLLRALLGLDPARSGRVTFEGRALAEWSRLELAQRLAFVPQRLHQTPPFTVEELVLQGRLPHAEGALFEGPRDHAAARLAMARTRIEGLASRRLDEISGGEAQRVLIAAALAQQPELLLLDEPSSALDLPFAVELFEQLDALRREGVAIVLATHDLNLASLFCDRLILLDGGCVHADAPPHETLTPEVLGEVYRGGWIATPHPDGARPQVLPRRMASGPSSTPRPREEEPEGSVALTPRRLLARLAVCGLLLLITLVVSPLLGQVAISLPDALAEGPGGTSESSTIFWRLRLPRVLLAALAGAGLAIAGAAFQALLRNPLATPYTLGVAGGASLGATLALWWGGTSAWLLGFSPVAVAAFVGALVSVLMVQALARSLGRMEGHTILLAGIAFSIISSSAVLLIQFVGGAATLVGSVRWLVGGVDVVGWRALWQTLPFTVAGVLVLIREARSLNALAVDPTLALARGVPVRSVERRVFLAASLTVGAVVAQVGPVGFVGLIVPHVTRRWVGEDHRVLLPACVLVGGAFLVIADTIARVVLAPNELPVGVITALIGGPTLVAVLVWGRRGRA